jgi:alpha-soluble NSF attachment protein
MSIDKKNANDYYSEGQNFVKKFWFFGKNKYEEANNSFIKAAYLYKLEKNWLQAAVCYQKSAECLLKLKNKYDAAVSYINSSHCYRNIDNSLYEVIFCIDSAMRLIETQKKYCVCAKYCIEISNIYEYMLNYEEAIEYMEMAIDFWKREGITDYSSQKKVAELYARRGMYNRAIVLFEELAKALPPDSPKRYMIKDYFFCALLLFFCTDNKHQAMSALEKYKSLDPNFCNTKECEFITKLLCIYSKGDSEEFRKLMYEYDKVSLFDDWVVCILLKIKSLIARGIGSNNP